MVSSIDFKIEAMYSSFNFIFCHFLDQCKNMIKKYYMDKFEQLDLIPKNKDKLYFLKLINFSGSTKIIQEY